MKSWLQSQWQKVKEHPISSIVILTAIIVAIALIVVIILGYKFDWDWTGLGPYTPPNSDYQRGKTFWDWLQLLVVPAVLAIAGYMFTLTTGKNERRATEQRSKDEQKAAEQHNKTERDIALDNQQENRLQDYLDRMSELLLEKNLRKSMPNDEVRYIAQARTLSILAQLKHERLKSVLQFLHNLNLISKNTDGGIISLEEANLTKGIFYFLDLNNDKLYKVNFFECEMEGINLSGADLRASEIVGCNLCDADLSETDLSEAYIQESRLDEAKLQGANLSESNLGGTNLTKANLSKADLREANLGFFTSKDKDFYRPAANLTGANLSHANLSKANLIKVNLTEADLSGAILSNANLREAIVSKEQLDKVKSLKGATMPDGTIHP